jgi:DNA (cytosine-5)-methyltransferase 1
MPENELQQEVFHIEDVPPLAPEHVGRPVRPEVRARAEARLERQRLERAAHNERLDAVEALQARCQIARRKRTMVYLEMLDLIAELPALRSRQRRAVVAEIFGLGRAEAGRLIKIGQLEAGFRELMVEKAIAPELIEALLSSPDEIRDIALAEIERGETIEKSDLSKLKRELERATPKAVAALKNRSLAASLINPVRERLKDLKASMREFAVQLEQLHTVGEAAEDLVPRTELVVETAAARLAQFESCFGKDRLMAAADHKRSAEKALSNLSEDQFFERLEVAKELSDNWSAEELRLTETHDALRKLAAGILMPPHEYDEDTDYYLSRYLLEAVAWYADYDLIDYSAFLDNIRVSRYGAHDAATSYYDERPLTSLELCAGAGGEAIGLHAAGFEPLGVFEQDKYALETLQHNYPFGPLFAGDLREIDFEVYRGKVDLLAGGVPCQPFSNLGDQRRDGDERDLFMDAVRIAAEVQPRAIMLENVLGFRRREGKLYIAEIISELRKAGYSAEIFQVAAKDYGLAQARPRVVLVAFQDSSLMRAFKMPPTFPQWNTTVGEAVRDLMGANGWNGVGEWARKADKIAPTLVGGSSRSGSQGFASKFQFDDWARIGIDGTKLATDAPAANESETLMPRLTIGMGARLQGFPDGWEFQGSSRQQRRQVANAFPPVVAAAVGLAIRQSLTGRKADFESVLDNLRFVPGRQQKKWWGDKYINSRLTLKAEELGLPIGIVARNVPNPALQAMAHRYLEPAE